MTAGLTPTQRLALDFIREYIATHGGVPPSYSQIATHVGVKSTSGAHRIIRGLVNRGHIRMLPGQARSISVVSEFDALSLAPDLQQMVCAHAAGAGISAEDALRKIVCAGIAALEPSLLDPSP